MGIFQVHILEGGLRMCFQENSLRTYFGLTLLDIDYVDNTEYVKITTSCIQ